MKINNNKYLLTGILSLVLIGGFNNVFAVSTINFDDKTAPVTPINSDYQDDGAIFSSASYVLTIIDDSGETPGPPSTPNILLSNFGPNNGDIIISVVDPSTHVPTDASSISFKLFSIGNNAVTVVAKDSSDSVIDTQVFQHNDVGGPNCNYPTEWPSGCPGPITNGWAQTDSYSFSGNIRTVTITSSQAVEGDGYGIDDVLVQFTSEPTVAGELMPLNTTALFVSSLTSSMIWMAPTILGIAGVGAYYIKSKKN